MVSNHDEKPAESTNADLWRIPLAEDGTPGEAVNLTAANHGWDGDPAYSPDGRYLAYRTQKIPGYESDLFRIALYDRKAGTSRILTEAFRNWITDVTWAPDGRRMVVQAEVAGRSPLYTLDPASGALQQVVLDAAIDAFDVAPSGDAVVYSRRSISEPSELYRAPLAAGGTRTQLTRHNADLVAEVDFRPAEEMWVEGEAGNKIQVFLVKPHDFDPAQALPDDHQRPRRPAGCLDGLLPRRLAGLPRRRLRAGLPQPGGFDRVRAGRHRRHRRTTTAAASSATS